MLAGSSNHCKVCETLSWCYGTSVRVKAFFMLVAILAWIKYDLGKNPNQIPDVPHILSTLGGPPTL